MTLAESAKKAIENKIAQGVAVYINTTYRSTKITPSTYKAWQNSGAKLFKIDREGNLRMARGRSYDIIVTPTQALVTVTFDL